MNLVIDALKSFELVGLSIEIGRSQRQNSSIIRQHWQSFNHQLAAEGIQLGNQWQKFGVTLRKNERLYYFTGVLSTQVHQPIAHFEHLSIYASHYGKYEQRGAMRQLASTFKHLYQRLDDSQQMTVNNQGLLVHFERYDNRFQFNRPDSIIDIYVPILAPHSSP